MALIHCPTCGREISEKAARCPGCGEQTEHGRIFLGRVLIAVFLIAFAVFLAWKQHTASEASRQLREDSQKAIEALERLHD